MSIDWLALITIIFCVVWVFFMFIDNLTNFVISNFITNKILGVESPSERMMGMSKENKPIGERIGWTIGFVITSCLTAIIVALTIKFIMWMF